MKDIQDYATDLIESESYDHDGYGAGSGSIDTRTYKCVCGNGTIVYTKDNIPGFRDKQWTINCEKCKNDFAKNQSKD